MLQTRAYADQNMLNAAVRDRTRPEILPDAERHKRQHIECTIAGILPLVSEHSNIVHIEGGSSIPFASLLATMLAVHVCTGCRACP